MVEAELWRTNWTPLHDPLEAPPGFGVRQSSGALAMQASQPKAPEDWRSPRRCRAIRRFMVPMHAEKRNGALPEPRVVWSPAFRRLELIGPAESRTPSCPRFMVPAQL